ncbi:hypothetical protein [Falsiroseomonas sp.]|uniref:hypothetical protein n=1 Tax=Falsiroseomonas sp. TaxID=2870721 RepID=UPI0027349C9D|nr:hypothetical protein [Falsiroseomonas sp.]MDP3415949.1 hypothetical protein [Falsiroseomonas sp.]
MTLSNTQSHIVREAAEHEAGLAPLPKIPAAARNAVFRSMLNTGLLVEVPAPAEHLGRGWRQDETGAWIALRMTDSGFAFIGLDPAGSAPVLPRSGTHAATAHDSPLLSSRETVFAPLDAPVDGLTLRSSAAAVITAWEAAEPLDTALVTLPPTGAPLWLKVVPR